ncbi:MAG: NADH-dependent oxidoreductase, partial [Thermoguttaceae bacterium]|nr:NADH-dependent oxidoreductase [Thermoguttaceae bacterium]
MTRKKTIVSLAVITVLFVLALFHAESVLSQTLKDWKKTIFLEAEGFANRGGWFLDTQYMDQLGSPVLLAHGYGKPVADAVTKVVFPEKGTWRVYVRTRNWVAPWTMQYAPGRFQLAVDGKWNATIFGTQSNPWAWQQGENIIIDRKVAELEVRLHDLTGFDGRVDAICFTQDKKFIPPNAKYLLAPLRR